jgi:DNA-binding transcriptional LysR family regulator
MPPDTPTPNVDRIHLFDDPMLVALPAEHRLAKRKRIDLVELAGEGWVQGRAGPATTLAERACLLAGYAPRIVATAQSPIAIQGLVAAGVGVTMLPALSLPSVRPDLALVPPIQTKATTRNIWAATRSSADDPALAAALNALAKACSTHRHQRAAQP